LDRGTSIGLAGGISLFLIIILFLMWQNSDFDQSLINSVESGVAPEKLIPAINSEKEKQEVRVKKNLQSHVLDPGYWSQPNVASEKDFNYYKNRYEEQMQSIVEYQDLRIKFVYGNVSKQEFLEQAKIYKNRVN